MLNRLRIKNLLNIHQQTRKYMTSIQLVSDLHLEFYESPRLHDFIVPRSPNLAIMGDFGIPYMDSYKRVIEDCSQNFKKTFIISGNHEYYQWKNRTNKKLTIIETDEKIKEITQSFDNVHFLQNQAHNLNDKYTIIGTTLWSHIPRIHVGAALYGMNDFRQIYADSNQLITPALINKLHDDNIDQLSALIDQNKDKQVIVMSHHLPSLQLISKKYQGHPLNCCFATNLEHLMKENVKYWFSGHTHDNFDLKINHCRCIINPYGYKNENSKFINDLVIKLE